MPEILSKLTGSFPVFPGAGTRHFVLLCGTGFSSEDFGPLLSRLCAFAWRLHSGGGMGIRTLVAYESLDEVFIQFVGDRASLCLNCGDLVAIEQFLGSLELAMLRELGITFSVVVADDSFLTVPDWCPSYRLPAHVVTDEVSLAGEPWVDAFLESDRFVAQAALSVAGGSAAALCREIRGLRLAATLSGIEAEWLQRGIDLWCCIFQLSGRPPISAGYSLSALVKALSADALVPV